MNYKPLNIIDRRLARLMLLSCRSRCKHQARNNSSEIGSRRRATFIGLRPVSIRGLPTTLVLPPPRRTTKKINSVYDDRERAERNRAKRSRSQNDGKLMDARSPTMTSIVDGLRRRRRRAAPSAPEGRHVT